MLQAHVRSVQHPYLSLDVLQHVLVTLQEVQMLELCVVSLRFHQTALLNVHHLTKTICKHKVDINT